MTNKIIKSKIKDLKQERLEVIKVYKNEIKLTNNHTDLTSLEVFGKDDEKKTIELKNKDLILPFLIYKETKLFEIDCKIKLYKSYNNKSSFTIVTSTIIRDYYTLRDNDKIFTINIFKIIDDIVTYKRVRQQELL